MDNAVATGRVWHLRRTPQRHRFSYGLYFTLFDVDQIDALCTASPWWSRDRFNLVTVRRSDFLRPHRRSLSDAVRDRVEEDCKVRPSGQVLLLTHLRQWGTCFNPVSFYLCLDGGGELEFIVSEIHNTPWGQRHTYVLDARDQSGPDYRFRFAKTFHVSPFLPMHLDYDWRFSLTRERIGVHMSVMDGDSECFAAGMQLALSPLDRHSMRSMPMRYPFLTLRVLAAIYWQALRLWLRRTPFFGHPDKQAVSK